MLYYAEERWLRWVSPLFQRQLVSLIRSLTFKIFFSPTASGVPTPSPSTLNPVITFPCKQFIFCLDYSQLQITTRRVQAASGKVIHMPNLECSRYWSWLDDSTSSAWSLSSVPSSTVVTLVGGFFWQGKREMFTLTFRHIFLIIRDNSRCTLSYWSSFMSHNSETIKRPKHSPGILMYYLAFSFLYSLWDEHRIMSSKVYIGQFISKRDFCFLWWNFQKAEPCKSLSIHISFAVTPFHTNWRQISYVYVTGRKRKICFLISKT